MKQVRERQLRLIASERNEKSFNQLFYDYATRLFQFSNSFLKNSDLAEEVVSDVFFKVWLTRSDLAEIDNIKAYLFRATYNTTLNYLNEERRKKALSLDDIDVDLGVDTLCPETDLISKELKQVIEQAIEALPPRCQLIYKMAKVEGMKYKEVAALLDISVKTIDHQVSIAVKRMGETIRKYLNDQGTDERYLILMQLFLSAHQN